ncbi:hypothetical protein L1887_34913 [Cichorium endivia]|nr:hypothetical protein L1887_34913 [Cichorium endivia]
MPNTPSQSTSKQQSSKSTVHNQICNFYYATPSHILSRSSTHPIPLSLTSRFSVTNSFLFCFFWFSLTHTDTGKHTEQDPV